jgi:hypothetical protein
MRIAKALGVAAALLGLSGMTAAPAGQLFQQTPCGIALPGTSSHGLTLVNDDTIVYDANQGLCWLSDTNLAGNPFVRALMNFSASQSGRLDGLRHRGELGQRAERLQQWQGVTESQRLAAADDAGDR